MARRKTAVGSLGKNTPAVPPSSISAFAAAAIIVAVTCVAYLPALRGGFIWDDDAHVTKPELRSLEGLARIWFDVGATQQYYPLLHSLFWVEHKAWGDSPLGYHLANLLLHAAVALLVYANLRTLRIPGALLAALIFAVHPIQVETVAWITEQKNTLSAVFYLGAMWFYLRFDARRVAGDYAIASLLFVLGLLSKTVTATLPAALLVIFWWQRGTLSWRRDVRPLVPWFALGAAAGVFTAWVELTLIGAGQGVRVVVSPARVARVSSALVLLWQARLARKLDLCLSSLDRKPGHLVAMAVSRGGGCHALGDVDVAAALASAAGRNAVVCRDAAAGAWLPQRLSLPVPVRRGPLSISGKLGCDRAGGGGRNAIVAEVLATFAASWGGAVGGRRGYIGGASARQCNMYRDAATLYETTIARNPDCWMAYLNLGAVRAETGRPQEAIELYQQALRIKPEDADVHANLGTVLVALGETESGLAQLKEAVRLAPRSSQTHYRYGIALLRTGQTDDAARQLAESARLFPDSSKIQNNLGVAMFTAGRLPEAIAAFGRAIELDPQFSDAYENLLGTLAKSGPTPEATAAAAIALSSARVAKLESAAQRLDDWLRQSQRPASTP